MKIPAQKGPAIDERSNMRKILLLVLLMCATADAQPTRTPVRKPTSAPTSAPADVWNEWQSLKIGMTVDEAAATLKGWGKQLASRTEHEDVYMWVHSETITGNAYQPTRTNKSTLPTWFKDGKLIKFEQPAKETR